MMNSQDSWKSRVFLWNYIDLVIKFEEIFIVDRTIWLCIQSKNELLEIRDRKMKKFYKRPFWGLLILLIGCGPRFEINEDLIDFKVKHKEIDQERSIKLELRMIWILMTFSIPVGKRRSEI